MKVEVNRLNLELLQSEPPPSQYDFPQRRSRVLPPPEIQPSPSLLPCTVESDSLGELADGQEVRPDDMTGKYLERIPMVRAHVSGGEGKVVPKRGCSALKFPIGWYGVG